MFTEQYYYKNNFAINCSDIRAPHKRSTLTPELSARVRNREFLDHLHTAYSVASNAVNQSCILLHAQHIPPVEL